MYHCPCQKILESEKQITDPAYIAESFENTELEILRALPRGENHRGTSSRLLMGAVDLKQALNPE